MTGLKCFTDEIPLRSGDYWPIEKLAKGWPDGDGERLGGVGKYDSQPWTPPVKTPIDYGPQKRLPTRFLSDCQYPLEGSTQTHWEPWIPARPNPWKAEEKRREKLVYRSDDPYGPGRLRLDDPGSWFRDLAEPVPDPEDKDDAWDSVEVAHKVRRKSADHGGKRSPAGQRVTMPPGSWHVDQAAEWSTAQTVCSFNNCGVELPAGQDKYCYDHVIDGNNERRRHTYALKKARDWPVDEHWWYIQSPPPPPARRLRVHTYDDYEARIAHTVSRDYRLRFPWEGETKAWRICQLAA
jgi:hypothetical protein